MSRVCVSRFPLEDFQVFSLVLFVFFNFFLFAGRLRPESVLTSGRPECRISEPTRVTLASLLTPSSGSSLTSLALNRAGPRQRHHVRHRSGRRGGRVRFVLLLLSPQGIRNDIHQIRERDSANDATRDASAVVDQLEVERERERERERLTRRRDRRPPPASDRRDSTSTPGRASRASGRR